MGFLLQDLVGVPQLQMTVAAGASGLDHQVAWAHVTEDPAPWDWLDPDTLVLTGGAYLPHDGPAQARFIETAAAAGLSGIVVTHGDRHCPELHDEMFEAADRVGFPIVRTPPQVGFVALIRTVAAANQPGETESLSQIVRVNNEVLASLMEERSSAAFIDGLARVVACRLHVVAPEFWEPLLPGCDAPDPVWRGQLVEELRKREGKAPLVMHLHVDEQLALAMPLPIERAAYLVAFPENERPPRLAVLQQVCAACALEMRRIDSDFERNRGTGAALLAEALQGRLDAKAVDLALAERGMVGPLHGIAIECSPQSIERFARGWAIRGIPFLLSGTGPTYVALIQADDGMLSELEDRVMSAQWRAGASDPFSGAGGIGDAIRQARWAMETVQPGRPAMARYGDGGHGFLPRTLAESQLAANQILGPLLEYDREHETSLVETLRAYLDCDRSPKRASQRLFVHTQTVNYRISRIQELTGRSMRSTGDVSELWFALRALALSDAGV